MRFYVIHEIYCTSKSDLDGYAPDRDLFVQTESFPEPPDKYHEDPAWKDASHRKYVADLSDEDFEQFVYDYALKCHPAECGSSLTEFGFLRNVLFDGESLGDTVFECRVTPHGTDSEMREWFRDHHQRLPSCLADLPGQRYLPGMTNLRDKRDRWTAACDALGSVYR